MVKGSNLPFSLYKNQYIPPQEHFFLKRNSGVSALAKKLLAKMDPGHPVIYQVKCWAWPYKKQTIFTLFHFFQAFLAYILFISFYVFDYRIQMGLNILWHFLPMGTISSHVQLGPSTTIKMALMRTQKLTICETITLVLIAQCCRYGFCRKNENCLCELYGK